MLSYIITPAAGAVIGYFTNWLAIKMLFYPHEEKYIGKFKLPFTPGLIAKEKIALANKIGRVTEDYVLTDETFLKYLNSQENKAKILNMLSALADKIKKNDYTIEAALNLLFKDKTEEAADIFEELCSDRIKEYINSESAAEAFAELITFIIVKLMKNENNSLPYDKIFKEFSENILETILNRIFDDDFIEQLKQRKVSEYINEDKKEKAFELLTKIMPDLFEKICVFFEENDFSDKTLRNLTKKVIHDNIGTIAGLFINSDKVFESIRSSLIEYLRSPENQAEIRERLYVYAESIYSISISDLLEKLPHDITELLDKADKDSAKAFAEAVIYRICESRRLETFNLFSYIIEKDALFESKIYKAVLKIWNNYIKDSAANTAPIILHKIKMKLMVLKINVLFDEKVDLNNLIYNLILLMIQRGSVDIVKNMSIANMIEEKINGFDMKMIEELIFSVVKKELNAITLVGGILGFIIGLVPAAIDLFL